VYVEGTEAMGLTHVTWHFEFGTNGSFGHLKAPDWKGIKGVASERDTFPNGNDIVLLHDRHWAGKARLVKAVLSKLSGAGFSFGRLDKTGRCA
jgi:hypothetical protein